ncbi:hypothetical protein KO561_04750 [Radiobacillus kanasensis]|uniref:hypothetical protein n=1 Tax=Radiobacillus kanasensis TaxID=2844358 RepID=UPI001E57DBE1|nr:hypothetical protein [Radiobacillus kanasensis]UFU00266.1 hypothetical protein KO561_04750 [Radiobacillus kanasensis]
MKRTIRILLAFSCAAIIFSGSNQNVFAEDEEVGGLKVVVNVDADEEIHPLEDEEVGGLK